MKALTVLRSWIKEERRQDPTGWRRRLPLTGLLLGIAFTALAGLRSVEEHHRLRDESETLQQLLGVSLHSLRSSAEHWLAWKPLPALMIQNNAGPVEQHLRDSAKLHPGDELLLFSPTHQLLIVRDATGQIPAAPPQGLACVRAQLPGLRAGDLQPLACAIGTKRIQLGVMAPVRGGTGDRRRAGTLVLLRSIPGQREARNRTSRLELALAHRLSWEVPAQSTSLPLLGGSEEVAPRVPGPGGRVLVLSQPLLPLLNGRSLLPDLLLAAVVLSAVLAARAIPMLERRQRRLIHLQAERLASRRIRRTSRKLDRLLEKLGHADPSTTGQPVEEEVMARLFGSTGMDQDPPAIGSRHLTAEVEDKLMQVASSYERLLSTARALALFDSLTDLPNRRYFFERLSIESQRSKRSDTPFVIMFIDVDKFKMINDTYGHHVGDAALIAVAEKMRQVSRKEDFIARYGGDEFAVIMDLSAMEDRSEENLKAQAYQFAVRLTELFQNPLPIAGIMLPVSLSVGITLVDSQEADPLAAIQRSDVAMYQAKKQIESRISVFDVSTNQHELDSYKLFADLQTALNRHDLRVLYQPIVNLGEGLHAFEALVRWRHPEHGDIPPDVLLGLADRYRLTLPLGLELITLAARGYASLRASLGGDPRLALNISGQLLSHPDMGETILNLLSSQLVKPERVTLEITEQSVMEMGRTTEHNLEFLRATGMQLSLDDFGTGHSSLMRLITLQPRELKIDKAFVMPLLSDSKAMRVVTLVATMARRMNLRVVAEGVESQPISEALLKLGITHQQGFYFSEARSSGDLIAAGHRAFQNIRNATKDTPLIHSNDPDSRAGTSGAELTRTDGASVRDEAAGTADP